MPSIKSTKAGLDMTVGQLETHYIAGGNVDRVVDASIAAQRAGIELPMSGHALLTSPAATY